ncbi:MAG: hypothetical protein M3Z30_01170, partial [Gemmatimonadota bacterium]|nr:hypothetical protein [Gemmatimonadota bacterium]
IEGATLSLTAACSSESSRKGSEGDNPIGGARIIRSRGGCTAALCAIVLVPLAHAAVANAASDIAMNVFELRCINRLVGV